MAVPGADIVTPTAQAHLNGDRWVWTEEDPDVELIEPRLLVSVDKNWLVFGHQRERPPLKRTLRLVNHGDHPVAFKIHTSDNFSYFVDQETGLISGRSLFVLPFIEQCNSVDVAVYRRPYSEFGRRPELTKQCKAPRKDRLFVYLAPVFGWSTEASSVFAHTAPFEKLRICLEYVPTKPDPSQVTEYLFEYRYGWNTWQTRADLAKARSQLDKTATESEVKMLEQKKKATAFKPKDPNKMSGAKMLKKAPSEEKTPDEPGE